MKYFVFALAALLTLTCGLTFASDLMITSGATLTATLADPGSLFAGLDFADSASALGAIGAGAVGRTSIQNLRDERNELSKDVRNLMDKDTGDNTWTDEDQKVYDEKVGRIEALDAKIARQQKVLDLEAEQHFETLPEGGAGEEGISNIRQLHQKWLRGGDNRLSAEEWAAIRNTMSTTTDAEGGYTVPTEVASTVANALKEYGGVRMVAEVIQTENGAPMNFPTSDGTSEVGELIGENASATDEDPDFGVKSLNTFKFSSKVITVPIELLQDSAVDIEAFVNQRIIDRLGRITNQFFTTGTGTGQPTGVVTASAAGKVGAVSATAAITYDDLVDLQHSVDPAYRRQTPHFMMNDGMLKLIRKLKDGDQRPVFLPSYDAGIRGGVPAELLGTPIVINQEMAAPAPEAISLLFGAFSHYKVRDAMGMTLFRFTDSAYAKKGQVGFLAWMRAGGNLVDVGGAIKHFQHGAAA
ncbi:MAG: phage major capsid protein [Abyssibacter sp.]|uniref:phage major capsid protein n=1 Tax=Abyssibacter sp. TaxID=2320200 RepID=UPI003219BDBE